MNPPADWQVAPGLFGLPLAMLGPGAKGERPVISVTPTAVRNKKFNEADLFRQQSAYRDGRESWLKRVGGRAIEYFPYQPLKWDGVEQVANIGYRYEMEGKRYVESSYYVMCKKRMYHLKYLLTGDHDVKSGPTAKKIVESFRCK